MAGAMTHDRADDLRPGDQIVPSANAQTAIQQMQIGPVQPARLHAYQHIVGGWTRLRLLTQRNPSRRRSGERDGREHAQLDRCADLMPPP